MGAADMTIRIDRAQPQDCDGVVELLAQNHLPPDGLREHLATLLVARQDGGIVGSAGLEIYSDGALLHQSPQRRACTGSALATAWSMLRFVWLRNIDCRRSIY